MHSIRPALIFFIGMFLFSACAPAKIAIPIAGSARTAHMDLASLPVTILQPGTIANNPNASSQDTAGMDPLLPELRNLVFQRRADLLSRPGWLHVVTRNTGSGNQLSSLWGALPETWQEEEWFEVGADGNTQRAVKRLVNENLQPLQSSVLVNHTWRNLTLGAESPALDSGMFDPNYGYYDLALRLTQQGHPISKGTIYKECWYQGEQYSISDGAYKYEVVFNPDRRSLRWLKTWKVSSGSIALLTSVEVLVEEWVAQPPAKILALMD